jgi:hypothetical protein
MAARDSKAVAKKNHGQNLESEFFITLQPPFTTA